MDHDSLEKLKAGHTTLKLLNAAYMPLIIGFLHKAFIAHNKRSLPDSELQSLLDDYLYHLRNIYGDEKYPKSAKAYLDDWSSGENAFLRKYYDDESDEPWIDLTPPTEKAMEWLRSLDEQHFIGTESRLLTVFQLLRDIVYKTEQDPEERIKSLEKQKKAIDREIEAIQRDGVLPYDATQIRERFFQVEDTARKLLADFRQVEHNFRQLDRETRERIAVSEKTKGALLDEIFHDQDVIWDSDQGKSFKGFWEFLMSRASQKELEKLIAKVAALKEVQSLDPDRFLFEIQYYLLDAGEKVYKTSSLLVEQLRKYLDDQAYLENRRIMSIIKDIEKKAIEVRDTPPEKKEFAFIDDTRIRFDSTIGRPLFTPPRNPVISVMDLKTGKADMEMDALYRQHHIDKKILKANIRKALETDPQVSLAQLAEKFPIQKGLSEALAYFHIAASSPKAMIDESFHDTIIITTEKKDRLALKMPRTIFIRQAASD